MESGGTSLLTGDGTGEGPEMCQPQKRVKAAGKENLPVVLFTEIERERERHRKRQRGYRPTRSIDALKEVPTGAGIRGASVDLNL